jgi:hypothetical protein
MIIAPAMLPAANPSHRTDISEAFAIILASFLFIPSARHRLLPRLVSGLGVYFFIFHIAPQKEMCPDPACRIGHVASGLCWF